MKNPTAYDTKNMTHCPVCRELTTHENAEYPFCSKRCSDVDLGRWMTGRYAVPAIEPEELEEAAEALAQTRQKPH